MAAEVALDIANFRGRLAVLLQTWKENQEVEGSPWKGLDAILLLSGRQDEERPTPKTDQLHLWLFGYVFPESLMVLLKDGRILFLTGPKKLSVLKQIQSGVADGDSSMFTFLEKTSEDGNKANVEVVLDAVRSLRATEDSAIRQLVGRFKGKSEEAIGAFSQQVEALLAGNVKYTEGCEEVALNLPIALLFAVHDTRGVGCETKAANLAVQLGKDVLIERVEEILDSETVESHADIAARAERALDDRKLQVKWKKGFDLDSDLLDLVYVNVQSGPKCDLKPSAEPTKEPLSLNPGTIILSVGTKYQDYTANVVRTLLFNTKKEHKSVYTFTLECLELAVATIKPGVAFSKIYETVVEHVREHRPDLQPLMTRSLGHTLGLEFRESSLTVNGKSEAVVRPGMVFNIAVGFSNIPGGGEGQPPSQPYSVWLADTVLVSVKEQNGAHAVTVLTSGLPKKLNDINYELSDDADPPPPAAGTTTTSAPTANGVTTSKSDAANAGVKSEGGAKGAGATKTPSAAHTSKSSTKPTQSASKKDSGKSSPAPRSSDANRDRKASATPMVKTNESVVLRDRLRSRARNANADDVEKLLERQKMLRKRKLEEIRERFRDGGAKFSTNKKHIKKMTGLNAYRDPTDFPKDIRAGRICLDPIKEAVLIPIPGFGHVPFHVSTIRNVFHQSEDKKFQTLRIQFQVPGSTSFGAKSEDNPFPDVASNSGLFCKEFIFRSSDAALPVVYRNLKELQKRIKAREEAGDNDAELIVQKALDLNRKSKRVMLKGLMVKHGAASRRVTGTLEAHNNGLRFSSHRSENIDINYLNIKHAFLQPCENELVVLIHFHLKSPIVVSKKRATDIQFYTEIGSQTDDLDQRRGRSSYDPDEIAEEQRERELKRRLNAEFKRFAEAVEEMARASPDGAKVEFDIPYRELAFHGVPKNSSQLILPTANALVQLSEWPPFVLTLEDIEVVSFERVVHGLRQFDIVFIFKDYTKTVRQITTVPIESLDTVKRWLNEIDIVWYESKGNLNWTQVLKTIREDVQAFILDGGFGIFLGEGEESSPSTSSRKRGGGADSDDSDEEDEDYKGDDSESSEDFSNGGDSDDDESLADENSLDDSGDEDEDSEEEEGLSWDELEKEAIREDRKRGHENEDEDERRAKRKKTK